MNQSFDFEDFPVAQEAEGPATGSPFYDSPKIQQMGNALGVACRALTEKVPVGYKRTEVGVIPEDWKVTRLGEIGTFSKGSGIKREDISEIGVPCIRYGELYTRYHNYISKPLSRIPLNVACKALPVASGDLLFAGSGETTKEIGRCSAYIGAEQAYAGGDIIVYRPIGQNPIFLGHLMNFSTIATQKSRMGQGDAVVHISARNLAQVQVGLPPLSEQCAIAEVLADVDGLFAALEVLIAKKRNVKQAAMQQLLTGKTRLPGFSGAWKMMRLGEFTTIWNQKVLPTNVPSDTPCVELDHIGQGNGRLLGCSTAHFSSSSKYRFRVGDVLFGRLRPYLRKFWLADRVGLCTTEIWPLVADPRHAVGGFLHALVQSDRLTKAACISYGTHMPRADWNVMRKLDIQLPHIREQRAIVSILSDMDAEITALERRRDKTQVSKQAIVQQLLSGRKRLA